MNDRQKILCYSILIMALIASAVAASAIYALYTTALHQQRARLIETAQSRARIIEAIARQDRKRSREEQPANTEEISLAAVVEAHKNFRGFGETGEFTLGRLDGDQITFLLRHRHFDFESPRPVPLRAKIAEPMRRALLGQSGTVIALDYRGEIVLAAYEPVAEPKLGIVTKIDLSEIRAPFVKTSLVVGTLAIILVLLGTGVMLKVNNPLIRRLESSEAHQRLILEAVGDGIVGLDLTGKTTFVNPAAARMLGYEQSELIGQPRQLPISYDAFDQAREAVFKRGDGTTFPAEYLTTAVRDKQGKLTGAVVAFLDISERKRAEQALQKSEERFRNIVANSYDAIFVIDPSLDKILDVNPRACEMLDYTYEELLSLTVSAVHPSELSKLRAFAGLVANHGRGRTDELTCLTKAGTVIPVEISASVAGPNRVICFVRDISERKRAQEELREREATIRALLENVSQAIICAREDGRIELVNKMVEQMFGYSREEVLGQTVEMLLPNRFRSAHVQHRANYFLQPHSRPMGIGLELTGCRKDGTKFPVEISLSYIERKDGIVAVSFVTDITERKKAEEQIRTNAASQAKQAQLRESEEQLRLITDALPALVSYVDSEQRYRFVNRGYEEWFGLSRSEIEGRHVKEILGDSLYKKLRGHIETALSGKEVTFDAVAPSKDNVARHIACNYVPHFGERGEVQGFFGLITDITERKRAEEALRDSQEKLRALAAKLMSAQDDERQRIARDLHDDLSQRLAGLAIAISNLKRQLSEPPDRVRGQLDSLQKQVVGISDDVRELSHRLHPSTFEHIGLVAALNSYCAEFTKREGIGVRVDARNSPERIPPAVGLCLYRVTQEALRNVAKHSGAQEARVTLSGTEDSIQLSVADSGSGFDVEQARRKRGLGLVSMEERVRQWGGSFLVKSKPQEGTELSVRIPLNREDP